MECDGWGYCRSREYVEEEEEECVDLLDGKVRMTQLHVKSESTTSSEQAVAAVRYDTCLRGVVSHDVPVHVLQHHQGRRRLQSLLVDGRRMGDRTAAAPISPAKHRGGRLLAGVGVVVRLQAALLQILSNLQNYSAIDDAFYSKEKMQCNEQLLNASPLYACIFFCGTTCSHWSSVSLLARSSSSE